MTRERLDKNWSFLCQIDVFGRRIVPVQTVQYAVCLNILFLNYIYHAFYLSICINNNIILIYYPIKHYC
jgi:hypothetical protein